MSIIFQVCLLEQAVNTNRCDFRGKHQIHGTEWDCEGLLPFTCGLGLRSNFQIKGGPVAREQRYEWMSDVYFGRNSAQNERYF